ncbi:hypothetical protein GCM10011340_06340 [Roseivirga thermotolerans]|uniref:3-keto-alpha-glucoside-1,2-lyase/3-keto-2-hydroxy-glucal hydratase domain-containing protein n=2 Tax=Roseivirgaceae TaxID=2762306 RepID=A0ABQ3I6A9_9BACT|nr:hypothetical protein GCM10011340_06340 [Roseivirga thermotolerans]
MKVQSANALIFKLAAFTFSIKTMKNKRQTALVALLLLLAHLACAQEWQNLIGDNLNNWKKLGGNGTYELQNGIITGTTQKNTPNTFLVTRQEYSDFILEFDIWVDPAINTGVQIRSHSIESYQNGRVHGYQVEIDPSPRAFSGGIYDEARRLWMYPISRNPKAHNAFKNGVWNRVRIEAIGPSIKTWINGIQCADLVDDMTGSGFIGLQVHSVAEQDAGKHVKWKNMRILTKNPQNYTRETDPSVPQLSYLINQLSDREKREGWRLLWDGKTSAGWRGAKLDHFPTSGWNMENGELSVAETGGAESAAGGDIITVDQFANFELELQFMLTEGANSGVKYFVDPQLNQGTGSAIGCEFQLLDDQRHPDAKMGVNGNRTLGALYDLIAPENLSIPGRGKQFKGLNVWNNLRIVSKNGKVEHWLNNEKVVEYDRFSQMFRALVAYSKYKDWKGFGQWPKGHILLQDHGNAVKFRSIKIREL